ARSCFPRPLSEPCVRFSLTRLSTGRSLPRDGPAMAPAATAPVSATAPTDAAPPAVAASFAVFGPARPAGSAPRCGQCDPPRSNRACRTRPCSARDDNTGSSRSDTSARPSYSRASASAAASADPAVGGPGPGTAAGPSGSANGSPLPTTAGPAGDRRGGGEIRGSRTLPGQAPPAFSPGAGPNRGG